ncbi:exopolysaccharide biosynthesis protein [Brevundimonas sp.]|uniref:exopolysaccharide biosynthesis protein n=1 Tax=Brevundimonas sp. TaxID=1871086 RepID=UPI0025EB1795|nr:exopolysaccharide biosynthesis protein [Brevundimonas sp.]
MNPSPAFSRTFSEVLEELGRRRGERLTVEEMVEAFGERAFGALMILISLMSLLPWPPGGKVVFAVPLLLLASELTLQRDTLWLPRWALNAAVSRERYAAGLGRVLPAVRFIERLSRPRMRPLTGPLAQMVIGLICLGLAIMLAFPVPFGDMLPAFTIAIFGFAVMQRDGVAAIMGLIGTVICIGYLALVWKLIVEIGERTWSWAQGLVG